MENVLKYIPESASIWYPCHGNQPGAQTGVGPGTWCEGQRAGMGEQRHLLQDSVMLPIEARAGSAHTRWRYLQKCREWRQEQQWGRYTVSLISAVMSFRLTVAQVKWM